MMASEPQFSEDRGLLFNFDHTIREIKSLQDCVKDFISLESYEKILPETVGKLEGLKREPVGKLRTWEISKNRPLETKPSNGSYDRKGRHEVIGQMTFKWEIFTVAGEKSEQPPFRFFSLRELASIHLQIVTKQDSNPLASWRFEIGSHDSPGCHVHAQIPTNERLPVPRLPSIVITPMDALEFLLGELFQDDWTKSASKSTSARKLLGAQQKKRLCALLEWQLERINRAGAPWAALKTSKPSSTLLVGKS